MTKHSVTATPLIPNWPGASPELKRALDLELAAARRDLAHWLAQRPSSKDSMVTTIALLETALDRYLAERAATPSGLSAAAADALDLIQPILRRAVQRRRVVLRVDQSKKAPPARPLDDEECLTRLTEMLTLLDVLADSQPRDAALRLFIDEAVEPLASLAGYFAGGIATSPALDTTESSRRRTFPLHRSEPEPAVPAPETEIKSPRTPFEVEERYEPKESQ